MAGPVITTLLSPNPAIGTTTTDGTEQTLASHAAAPGTYVLRLDTHNMQDGDGIQILPYNSADGANQRVCGGPWNLVNVQTRGIFVSDPIPTADYIKFTVQRVAGTDRAYAFSVINLNGT